MLKKAFQSLLIMALMVFALPEINIGAKTKGNEWMHNQTFLIQEEYEQKNTIVQTRTMNKAQRKKTTQTNELPKTGDHAGFIFFYTVFLVALSIVIRLKKRSKYE